MKRLTNTIISLMIACNVSFAANQLTVNFGGTGAGNVISKPSGIACTQNPCFGNFSSGKLLELRAIPDVYSVFSGWNGGVCSGTYLCTQTLNADTSITALFNKAPMVKTTYPLIHDYSYISDAYNDQQGAQHVNIKALAGVLSENLYFASPIDISISGGYDSSFTNFYDYIKINGSMKISKGKLTVKNLVLTNKPITLTALNNSTVTQSQTATILVSNTRITDATYSGYIDNNPISLTKSSDSALTFMVPILTDGIHTLAVNINGQQYLTTIRYSIPADGSNTGTIIKLYTSSYVTITPSLAMSEGGNAFAVWADGEYPIYSLWYSTFNLNSGWTASQPIGTGTGSEISPKVAVNSSGTAVLVWRRGTGNSREVFAANYDPVNGWGAATVLDSSGFGLDPNVSIDDSGNANVVWERYDDTNMSIQTNTVMTARYSASGWNIPQTLQPNAWMQSSHPLSGNITGMSSVIWKQSNQAPDIPWDLSNYHKTNSYVSIFTPETGWSTTQPVGNDVITMDGSLYFNVPYPPGHYNERAAIDNQGNVLAIWSETQISTDRLPPPYFNRYEVGKGWGKPQQIINLGIPSDNIIFDNTGTAYVIWTNYSKPTGSTYISDGYIAKYTTANGWTVEKILDNYPYYCGNTSVVLGKNGSILMFWIQSTGYDGQLWTKKYTPDSGWSSPARLDNNSSRIDEYKTATDASGNVLVIWNSYSGSDKGVWSKLLN